MKKKLFVLLLALAMCLSLLPITTPAVEPTAASTTISALPVVTLGANCEAVKLMQTRLKELGYDCGAVDGIFGSKTHAAVTAFQKDMGIAVDGITGPITWDKLFPGGDTTSSLGTASVMATISSDMPLVLFGSSGEAVKILQEKLNALGYDCGAVDGKFGAKTLAAVKAYQTAKGLTADGKVGPLTWGSMTATGNSSGRSHRHSDPEPDYSNCVFKAVLDGSDEANITLTFYFDESDHDADGESILLFDELPTAAESCDDWEYFEYSESIQRVVIDSSVKNYTGLTSTAYMFCGIYNAQSITGAENLSISNVTDMSYMFHEFGAWSTVLNAVPDVSKWDTSNVTDMSNMFYNFGSQSTVLNAVPDVSEWDTSKVTSMNSMFDYYGYYSTELTTVPDVSEWDTSNVTDTSYMFCTYGAYSAAMQFELDLTGWSLESLENGEGMFYLAGYSADEWSVAIPAKTENKTNRPGRWYYNGSTYIEPAMGRSFILPITDGPTLKAVYNTDADANVLTFYYDKADHSAQGTVYDDLSPEVSMWGSVSWAYDEIREGVKKVVIDASVANDADLDSTASMFENMYDAESITGAENLPMSNVTDMSSMFYGFGYNCATLNTVPDVGGWDTSNVENMSYMFCEYGYNSAALNAVPDVSEWDTSNVKNIESMFYGYGWTSVDLNAVPVVSGWDTSKLTDMSSLFRHYGYSSTVLNAVPDVSEWDTSNVTDMFAVFLCYGCDSTALTKVPNVSNWKTANVTTMNSMFELYGYSSTDFAEVPDVSGWNTSKLTNTGCMFESYGYSSTVLNDAPDVSNWDTENVTDMRDMFNCYGNSSTVLTAVPDVSHWNTANLTNMDRMFYYYGGGSTVLSSVPAVSGWNTAKVLAVNNMFRGYGYASTVLDFTLDLSGWSLESLENGEDMFSYAGPNAPTWSVTIPAATGDKANDEGHWYLSDGTSAITPHSGKNFTVAGE